MKSMQLSRNSGPKPNKEPKLSRTHGPVDLSRVDWQRGLRRQFGREQAFGLENLGSEPFFSEFRVSNPVSKSSYRAVIRGLAPSRIHGSSATPPPARRASNCRYRRRTPRDTWRMRCPCSLKGCGAEWVRRVVL
jgi:hypothetical protein